MYNWVNEEWTRLSDLPKEAAFATCGKVDINGKKFIFLYGMEAARPSRTGSLQIWSYETETWSTDIPQPPGLFRSLPAVVSTGKEIYLFSGKTSYNATAGVDLSDTITVFSNGVWTDLDRQIYMPRQKASAIAVPRSALPNCTKKFDED